MRKILSRSGLVPVLLFSVLGFLAMGYHPGAEDDAVYLSSVKADLNHSLYPHDAAFFQLQMRTSLFDNWMAHFVRFSGIPVAWSELLWQAISILLIVWACWTIVCQLFEEASARWGSIALLAAMFTLPVAGTALYIADQYLHPRNPATALILFAVSLILSGRRWQAIPLLLVASVLHPLMGAFGVSFCVILALVLYIPRHPLVRRRVRPAAEPTEVAYPAIALAPLGWLIGKPSPSYLEALQGRLCYQLYHWEWYEWLGALAPLVIFWAIARVARHQGDLLLSRLATALVIYGVFQQIVAMVILSPAAPPSLSTLEPMRFLQLIYVFLMVIGGAYLGRHLLKARVWRWAVFLILANGGMFIAQRQLFAGTEHIELPGSISRNQWLQAFNWIRTNTPENAYFALDPQYMAAPGEDYHSFRAWAERSKIADNVKDPGIVTKAPELGPEWQLQVHAQEGWDRFQLADFERLKSEFGVDWVVVRYPQTAGLTCPWHDDQLTVCRVP